MADGHKKSDGLKKLRSGTGKTPLFECENCGCKRYSQCGCMKPGTQHHSVSTESSK